MIRGDKKYCKACDRWKPATTEHFYRNGKWFQSKCKSCDNAYRSAALGHGIYDRIARELGVTPARVAQIERSAIEKIRRSALGRELLEQGVFGG